MSRLVLPGALLGGIFQHLEGAYPHEGVGALLGTPDGERRRVERQIPLANAVSRNRRRRYEVAPEELVRIQRDARGDGLEVLGYYHSHPDAEPVPSESDREAGWPWYVYVIVRVAGGRAGGAGGVTAWQLRDDRSTFDPVHLEVLESSRMPTNVKILVPTPLRAYVDEQDSVLVPAATVEEALASLVARYGKLRPHLYAENGQLRSFVNVYLNDDDVRYLKKGATPVEDGDTISIIPSIAGGAEAGSGGSGGSGGATITEEFPSLAAARNWEAVELTPEEVRRYSRHLIMPEVGMPGQKKMKAARVLLIGAGGLGSPVGLYLAAAGVGTLGIVDFDVVDVSNLQRQVLHGTKDVGRPKLESARERIEDVNPNVRVVPHETRLTSENALEILKDYDVVVDGTDNFPTRYLVNDACVLLGKPNVYGSIFRFEGQASVFWAAEGPCYRCLYPEPPPPGLVPSCAEGGVLGVLPGLVGAIQATETIKLILGRGRPLVGRLLLVDALKTRFREVRLRKDPECPVCGERPTVTELIDYQAFCGLPQAEEEARREAGAVPEIAPTELRRWLDDGRDVQVLDVREPYEWDISHLDRAQLIPLGSLPERMHELDSAREYVVHCRTGGRSARAVSLLRDAGFRKVWNLQGGINAWADQVDPDLPKY